VAERDGEHHQQDRDEHRVQDAGTQERRGRQRRAACPHALAAQADQVDHLARRAGPGVVAGVQRDGFRHGQVLVHAGLLEHDADPGLDLGPLPARITAEHRDLAAVPVPVPLEDLDGRRLARPVRPEQREDLP